MFGTDLLPVGWPASTLASRSRTGHRRLARCPAAPPPRSRRRSNSSAGFVTPAHGQHSAIRHNEPPVGSSTDTTVRPPRTHRSAGFGVCSEGPARRKVAVGSARWLGVQHITGSVDGRTGSSCSTRPAPSTDHWPPATGEDRDNVHRLAFSGQSRWWRRRYSVGLRPVHRRTARVRPAGDEKPTRVAMVVMGRPVVVSSNSARSRCTRSTIAE
jgi:hypothetical protein